MNTTTLQIPLSKTLKNEAKKAAKEQGFSSLQEYVRILLVKLSRQELTINIEEPAVKLSKKAERRYGRMMKDFEMGRNVYHATSVEDLIKDLHED